MIPKFKITIFLRSNPCDHAIDWDHNHEITPFLIMDRAKYNLQSHVIITFDHILSKKRRPKTPFPKVSGSCIFNFYNPKSVIKENDKTKHFILYYSFCVFSLAHYFGIQQEPYEQKNLWDINTFLVQILFEKKTSRKVS